MSKKKELLEEALIKAIVACNGIIDLLREKFGKELMVVGDIKINNKFEKGRDIYLVLNIEEIP